MTTKPNLDLTAVLPCGCSRDAALEGRCQTFGPDGERRTGDPELWPICRSNVRNLVVHLEQRQHDVQARADELRRTDAASFAEHQCIADTFMEAADSVWDLLGGRLPIAPSHFASSSNDLVERLRKTYMAAFDHSNGDGYDESVRRGIRAILSELTTIPVEMPDVDELARVEWIAAYGSDDYTKEKATEPDPAERGACFAEQRRQAIAGLEFIRARLGPILAAKDAERERLTTERAEAVARAGRYAATIERQRGRIAELESQNEFLGKALQGSGYDTKDLCARIAELEGQLAQVKQGVDWHVQLARTATGKKPGLVLKAAYERLTLMETNGAETDELAAQAVLRAFGVDALRRVRERIAELEIFEDKDGEFGAISVHEALAKIDAELANFGAQGVPASPIATSSATTPRIFLGITFERERPDGSRENVDPSTVRLVVGDDPTPLVLAGVQKDRAT